MHPTNPKHTGPPHDFELVAFYKSPSILVSVEKETKRVCRGCT